MIEGSCAAVTTDGCTNDDQGGTSVLSFVTGKPIQAKVSWITTEVPLWGAQLTDSGWLLADYQETDGSITRYAVPPSAVVYVKQAITPDELGANLAPPVAIQPNLPAAAIGD